MPVLVRNDAGADADRGDNIGKVRTKLPDEGLLVAWTGQEPAVKREWVERTEEAQAMEKAGERTLSDRPGRRMEDALPSYGEHLSIE